MKKLSYWMRSGIFSSLERVSILFFGLFTFIILIRYLSKDEFGVWVLFTSITTIVELIRNGVIKSPLIIYRNSSNPEELPIVETAALVLNIIVTILILLILIALAYPLGIIWKAPQLPSLIFIYIITSVFLIIFSHFEFLQQANMNFKANFYSYAIQKGLFFVVLVLVSMMYELTLNNVAFIQAGTVMVSTFFSFLLVRKNLVWSRHIDLSWIKKLFSYGKYTLGTNLSSIIMRNIDSWMLGIMISPVAVALYNPAVRVANLLEVPLTSLASVMFPRAIDRIRKEGRDAAKELYEKSVSVIFASMIPLVIFIIIFAKQVVLLIAGDEYLDAVPILRVTMLYGLVLPFNRQLGVILDAMGKAKINMMFVARNALINIILNYLFIKNFGVIGAAYATLLTFVISFFINQHYLNKHLEVRAISYINHTLSFYKKAYKLSLAKLK